VVPQAFLAHNRVQSLFSFATKRLVHQLETRFQLQKLAVQLKYQAI